MRRKGVSEIADCAGWWYGDCKVGEAGMVKLDSDEEKAGEVLGR